MLKDIGKTFCISLIDYASNDLKVREAIAELDILFPPPKAEEGLNLQFGASSQQDKDQSQKDSQTNQNGYQNGRGNGATGAYNSYMYGLE